jgi:hypothetical protein
MAYCRCQAKRWPPPNAAGSSVGKMKLPVRMVSCARALYSFLAFTMRPSASRKRFTPPEGSSSKPTYLEFRRER